MAEFQPITVHLPIHPHAADIINRLGAWQREMREAGLDVSTSPTIGELLHTYMETGPDTFYRVIVHMEIGPSKNHIAPDGEIPPVPNDKDGKHE